MTGIELLSGSLILAGLIISYQMYMIQRYRRVLRMAQMAMQDLLIDIMMTEAERADTDSSTSD